MSFLRASTFSRLTRRAPIHCRTLATTPFRRAQGYGHGDNNQDTSTTSTQESAEHPGPAAPADASAESGGSRSKEAKETGSSPTGGQVGTSGPAAQPKIHDNATPAAEGEERQKEVDQHNKEFEQGHDRAAKAEDDKVDKKFWSGEFISG